MRIVVATESFAPRTDEAADTSRHIVEQLLAAGHQVLVITGGIGAASWRGARVVRTRGLPAQNSLDSCLTGFGPDQLIAVAPRLVGVIALRTANRRAIPTLAIDVRAPRPQADNYLTTCADSGRDPLWLPGVDLEENHPRLRDEDLRTAWAKGNSLVVGHYGSLAKDKVLRRLERIAALPEVRLVVIGANAGSPAAARLKAAGAKIASVSNGLDISRALASVDVVVQARKKDRTVPAVRRALAAGVPVVGFDAAGTAHVVTDGINGLLVDPLVAKQLTEPIQRLLADPELLGALAARARDSVADRSWTRAVGELPMPAAAAQPVAAFDISHLG